MARIPPSEIYRREAERLRSMADCFIYYDVRDSFLAVARRYDLLSRRAASLDELAARHAPRERVDAAG